MVNRWWSVRLLWLVMCFLLGVRGHENQSRTRRKPSKYASRCQSRCHVRTKCIVVLVPVLLHRLGLNVDFIFLLGWHGSWNVGRKCFTFLHLRMEDWYIIGWEMRICQRFVDGISIKIMHLLKDKMVLPNLLPTTFFCCCCWLMITVLCCWHLIVNL